MGPLSTLLALRSLLPDAGSLWELPSSHVARFLLAPPPLYASPSGSDSQSGSADGSSGFGRAVTEAPSFAGYPTSSAGQSGRADGGGGYGEDATPTSANSMCVDVPLWVDSQGYNCLWYGEHPNGRCLGYGLRRKNMNHTASSACCVCVETDEKVSLVDPGHLVIYSAICAAMALVYHERVSSKRGQLPEALELPAERRLQGDFKVGLWNFWEDKNAFVCVCLCSCLRIPDTYNAADFMTFWQAFATYLGVNAAAVLISYAIYGTEHEETANSTYNLLLAAGMALTFGRWRGGLRQRLGSSQQRWHDEFFDIAVWFFASVFCCSICPAIQEARQVDMITGQTPTMQCGLEALSEEYEMVGPAVATRPPLPAFSGAGHRLVQEGQANVE